jgi:REP element-mobilizing transposase RayT
MGSTHTSLLIHIIFATKNRTPWLSADVQQRLFGYLGGVIRDKRGALRARGGMPDHVHLLLSWRPDAALSSLMRDLKAGTSRWIHREIPSLRDFAWQDGYAAFSVSESQRQRVISYIANQRVHHRRMDFHGELKRLLLAHNAEFDERYL